MTFSSIHGRRGALSGDARQRIQLFRCKLTQSAQLWWPDRATQRLGQVGQTDGWTNCDIT